MRQLILYLFFFFAVSVFGQTPTVPATNIIFSSVMCNEFIVSWTNGNGNYRIVFVREGTPFTDVPVFDEFYTDNSIFKKGEAIKSDSLHFCVYKGPLNRIKVTGLKNNTKYYAAVFEYNGGGGVFDYLVSTYPMDDTTTKNIVAKFSINPYSQCLSGNSFSFINQSYCDLSPLTFMWEFGDGNSSTAKDPTYSYKKEGIMHVKLNAIAPGCYNSAIIKDTVYPQPFAKFDLDPSKPNNDSIQCWYGNRFTFRNSTTLNDIGAGPSAIRYEWHAENTISTGYKADYHFNSSGTKIVKLVAVSNRGCRDSTYQTYKVLTRVIDPAKVIITPKSMNLVNNKFTFTNTSPLSKTHKWYIKKKYTTQYLDSFAGNTWTYSFAKPGIYYIYFESYDTAGCYDRLKDSVEVIGVDGVQGNFIQTFSIYPNPSTTGIFYLNKIPVEASIFVYSILGKELLKLNPQKSNSEINLTRFGAGTFILSIWSEGKRFDYRLIVL